MSFARARSAAAAPNRLRRPSSSSNRASAPSTDFVVAPVADQSGYIVDYRIGGAAVAARHRGNAEPRRFAIGNAKAFDRIADAPRRHRVEVAARQQRGFPPRIGHLAEKDDAIVDAQLGGEGLQTGEIRAGARDEIDEAGMSAAQGRQGAQHGVDALARLEPRQRGDHRPAPGDHGVNFGARFSGASDNGGIGGLTTTISAPTPCMNAATRPAV